MQRGDLRETVSVTAPVQAHRSNDLTFLRSGEVSQVNVTVGQRVQAGDVLMELDTSQLQLDIVDAQLAVDLQRLALERLQAGPDQFDVAAAAAAVKQAQAQLDQITKPPDEDAIRIAQANLQVAESKRLQVYQTWTQRGEAYGQQGYQWEVSQQQANAAEMAVQIAVLQLANAQQGASSSQVAKAQASVQQAQASLNRMFEGPNDVDLQLAQISIQQSQLSLDNARATLTDAQVIAPYAGIVGVVSYDVGEQATAGLPAVTILDNSSFYADVLVDEVDVARVRQGQLAFIQLDAYPDAQLTGHVGRIAPEAVSVSGVNSYQVRVTLEPTDTPIRNGMTATVDIIVSELTNVLLVPNWAIRFDRATGQAYASVQRGDGSVKEVEVQIGVRGTEVSEVRSGLNEGDTVVVSLAPDQINVFGGATPAP